MPKRKIKTSALGGVVTKQKPERSFSIPRKARKTFSNRKNLNAGEGCSTEPIVHVLSEEKLKNETEAHSSTFDRCSLTESNMFLESSGTDVRKDSSLLMDTAEISEDLLTGDDGWLTDSTVEMMRASDLMSLDNTIPPPLCFSDGFDLASSEFLHSDSGPKASTPLSFAQPLDGKSFRFSVTIESIQEAVPKVLSTSRSVATQHGEPFNVSNVSSVKKFSEESVTLKDHDFDLKSLSPEQMIVIPDISFDAINESQEQREDSVFDFEAPASEGFKFYANENTKQNFHEHDRYSGSSSPKAEHTKQNFHEDDRYSRNSSPKAEHTKQNFHEDDRYSRNSSPKAEHTKQNFHEDDRYSRKSSPGASFISESTESYSGKQKQQDKVGNSLEDPDGFRNEDGFGGAPNIYIDSFNKKEKHSHVGTFVNLGHEYEPEYLVQDKCDNENIKNKCDSYENIKIIPNEEVQNNELKDSLSETRKDLRKFIKRFGFSRSVSFNRKIADKKGDSIKDADCNSRGVHFKESQNIPIDTPKREGNFKGGIGIKGSNRKKTPHTNVRGNLFEDISKNDDEDKFENVRSNHHDRKKAGKSSEGTDSHSINDNFEESRIVEFDTPEKTGNVINCVKTPFRKQHVYAGGSPLEDININNDEDNFENNQSIYHDRENAGKSFQGTDNRNYCNTNYHQKIGDNFEDSRIIEFDTPEKMGNVTNRGKTPFKKQYADAGASPFEDNQNENENNYQNIQNIFYKVGNCSKDPDIFDESDEYEEPQNIKIDVPKKRRFFSRGLAAKSFNQDSWNQSFKSFSSNKKPRGKKRWNEKGNSSKDMNQSYSLENMRNNSYEVGNSSKDNGEVYLQSPLNTQTNTSKKQRNSYRGVGNTRKRGRSRPQKAVDSFRKSQNPTSLKEREDLMENQNEAGNNWPHCCFEAPEEKTFKTLKPVYRDDFPIDDITLVTYDILRKNCKH